MKKKVKYITKTSINLKDTNIVQKKLFLFRTKEIHGADKPYDVDNCDMVTFQYCKHKSDVPGFIFKKNHITSIIDLTQTHEQLWHNISDNTRRLINKAKKENIQIQINVHYDEFYNLYKEFMKQKKYTSFYGLLDQIDFGALSKNTMKNHGMLFTASYQNEIITGTIFLESQTTLSGFINASKRLMVDKTNAKRIGQANRLIIWEAIKYAKMNGKLEVDLGGIFTDEEVRKDKVKKGIREFKMQFGGKKVTRYQYIKIYSKTLNFIYFLNYYISNLFKNCRIVKS